MFIYTSYITFELLPVVFSSYIDYNVCKRSLPASCKEIIGQKEKTMKILEELWYNGLRPSEIKRETNIQYSKQLNIIEENREKLCSTLSEEEREIFEKILGSQAELSCMDNCEIFSIGFRMGARMMLEVLDKKDSEQHE